MNFSPFELSVKQVLSGDMRYKIPNFQRDFSWENNNFDDFYDDLMHSSKLTITDLTVETDNKYFFGMILLLGDKSSPDVEKPYEVIDGQQRLTTMTLFFAAIVEIIKQLSTEYETEFKERLLFNSIKGGKSSQIQRLVNEALDPILPVSILNLNNLKYNGAVAEPESYEQNWLLSSYDYIKNLLSKDNISVSLNNDSKDLDNETYIRILDNLGTHLSNSTMICIFHSNKEEANNLFRNLNYRGKPLSQSDLIKNEIFSIIEDESKFASITWKKTEENIYGSGENIQKFLYHYMYGRFTNITNNNIFEKFLSNVKATEDTYITFLNSIKEASNYYNIILKPNDSDKIFKKYNYFKVDNNPSIKRDLEFFKNIEISQLRILLITLFECRDKSNITNTIFRKYIKSIAMHQCLHVLVSSSPNKLTSIYANTSRSLINLVEKDKVKYKIKVEEILIKFKKDLESRMPDLNLVRDAKLSYTGKNSTSMKSNERKEHALIRFILQTLSEHKQDSKTNKGNDGLGFIHHSTLEHIVDKENKLENVFCLGNIILLERDVHKDVKTFEEKKDMYSNSKITLTNTFFEEYPNFDESKITERQKRILETYYQIVKSK